jgi:hypothetical protein
MGTIHALIMEHGVAEARKMADTEADRRAVEAAALVLSEEESKLGITHAGFALTSLPHRRIEEPVWQRQGHMTTLLVESGRDQDRAFIGIPYGSLARLILIYLQTEAIRTGSPEVLLGRSMNAWLHRMGIAHGGRSRTLVSEQAKRISACRLTFFTERSGMVGRANGAFVRNAISLSSPVDDNQPALWQDHVRLDDGFWESLREHPVPVREEAIRAIGAKSMSMDIYIWLAYRLHSLSKPTSVSWAAIHSQFGGGFGRARAAKGAFCDSLKLALAVYPEARVDVEDGGIIMHPSAPAVPKSEARRIGM